MSTPPPELHDDLLRGASEIAEFLFKDSNLRRRIYHLIAHSRMPSFRIGSMICARKSVLYNWIAAQEKKHANDNSTPHLLTRKQKRLP